MADDPTTPGEIVGRNIRAVREAQLLSQRELAERSGVAKVTIATMELGRSARPRRRTVEKIANALGVPVEELMSAEAPTPKQPAPPSPEQPSFNGLLDEERRRAQLEEIRESYREEREEVARYLARWKQWLETGGIPEEAVREFLIAARAFYPALRGLLRSELTEITIVLGLELTDDVLPEEAKAESCILPLVERYWELGRKLTEVWSERFPEEPPVDLETMRREIHLRRAG